MVVQRGTLLTDPRIIYSDEFVSIVLRQHDHEWCQTHKVYQLVRRVTLLGQHIIGQVNFHYTLEVLLKTLFHLHGFIEVRYWDFLANFIPCFIEAESRNFIFSEEILHFYLAHLLIINLPFFLPVLSLVKFIKCCTTEYES